MSRLTTKLAVVATAGAILAAAAMPAAAGNNAGAAFLGGLIVGGVLSANQPPIYAPAPVYQVAPQPVYQPQCWYKNRQVQDPYTGQWVWRQVQVCR
ncbi:MAG: hypothetical protein WBO55_19605 [Rhizobiaceae bacterium]